MSEISSSCRRTGGKELLASSSRPHQPGTPDFMNDAGALRLVLQTEGDNDAAIQLYEDSGYTVVKGYCSLTLSLA